MEQNIRQTVVRDDEAISPANIKPLYQPIDTNDCNTVLVIYSGGRFYSAFKFCRFRHLQTQPIP